MIKPPFKTDGRDPAPLRVTVQRQVRFEEVDPLGIVWHGRYPSFFEDARVALGERYGIGYMDLHHRGVATPIKQLLIDYQAPLRFMDDFTIEGLLHWTEAARLNYEFIIRGPAGGVATRGYTVQMMLDHNNEVLLAPPDFYLDFRARWQRGELA